MLEKLSAIIPTPRTHLAKHSGVFSSHHSMRQNIILQPEIKKGFYKDEETGEPKRYRWSKLLARIFKVDVETCVKCGSKNTMISKAIFSPSSIERYLKDHVAGSDPPKISQNVLAFEPSYEASLD